MNIVLFCKNAGTFHPGFAGLVDTPAEVSILSDSLDQPEEAAFLAAADVVIGIRYGAALPALSARLFQLPAAGYDGVDFATVPQACAVCNAFGHEGAIAEYVMAAPLSRHVPLADADARLRCGDWHYWAGGPNVLRSELGNQSIGIIGHGHIGRAVAARALAFGMQVHVANRSAVTGAGYAATYGLDDLKTMLGRVDIVLNTLPLSDQTKGLIGAAAFAVMQPHAIVMNVGRGPVIDEQALFDALSTGRIGGATLDTWYVYPSPDNPNPMPGTLPFLTLPNVTLTPHLSGWTEGTVRRRTETCAENVNRLAAGKPLLNLVGQGLRV
jgi:phosphoglycerate dehydrogenase-like enzyme